MRAFQNCLNIESKVISVRKIFINSNVDPLTYLIPNKHNLVLPIIQEIEVRNIIMALKNTASGYDCNCWFNYEAMC